jgi:hypothetical protein
MGNGNIVPDINRPFLVSAVDYCAVLDIHVISDSDIMNIAPDNGIEPYTAVIPHHNITGYRGIIGQKTILSEFRNRPFYGFYQCHLQLDLN